MVELMRERELRPTLALEGGAPRTPYRERTAEYRPPPTLFAHQHNVPDGAFHAILLSVDNGQPRIRATPLQLQHASTSLAPCFSRGLLSLKSRFRLAQAPERKDIDFEAVLSALVPVEQTELACDLEDLALITDHIVVPPRSRPCPAVLSDRPARPIRTPRLRQAIFGSRFRRVLLHRGGCRWLFFCGFGDRGRCFPSCGLDLESRLRTEAFLEDCAKLLEVSGILGHPDVEALLLGVDEQQHATVEALDPRFAVDRSCERLPAALELAYDLMPLGGEVNSGLSPVIRAFENRNVVGLRIRVHSFLRRLSLRKRLLSHGISCGPRGNHSGVSVLYRSFEGLQSIQDGCHIRFCVIAGELEEDKLQLQLGVSAASHKAQGVTKCFDEPHDPGCGNDVRLLFELGAFLGSDLGECDLGGVREEHQVSQVREEFADELAEILPPVREAVHYAQGVRGSAFMQGVGRLDERLGADAAKQLAHHGGRDPTLRE